MRLQGTLLRKELQAPQGSPCLPENPVGSSENLCVASVEMHLHRPAFLSGNDRAQRAIPEGTKPITELEICNVCIWCSSLDKLLVHTLSL